MLWSYGKIHTTLNLPSKEAYASAEGVSRKDRAVNSQLTIFRYEHIVWRKISLLCGNIGVLLGDNIYMENTLAKSILYPSLYVMLCTLYISILKVIIEEWYEIRVLFFQFIYYY